MTLHFERIRSEYSNRIDQLEKEILSLCQNLQQATEAANEIDTQMFDCVRTDRYYRWHFDMREFSIEHITLEVRDRSVKLHAHRKLHKQSSEMIKRFALPDRAETQLSATMRRNGILIIEAPLKQS
ncbi:hypothetical protein KR222_007810 [Zaprionus bogoriensis]|nr:hypothetical protein KR222_007810 [Zaprionus bogoriensis]